MVLTADKDTCSCSCYGRRILSALHKRMDYPTKLLATQDLAIDMLIAVVGGFTLRIY